jgi:hypothetical protein
MLGAMSARVSNTGNRLGPGLAIGALVLIAAGILLWARFGTLVYFDTIAAAFLGCFI